MKTFIVLYVSAWLKMIESLISILTFTKINPTLVIRWKLFVFKYNNKQVFFGK